MDPRLPLRLLLLAAVMAWENRAPAVRYFALRPPSPPTLTRAGWLWDRPCGRGRARGIAQPGGHRSYWRPTRPAGPRAREVRVAVVAVGPTPGIRHLAEMGRTGRAALAAGVQDPARCATRLAPWSPGRVPGERHLQRIGQGEWGKAAAGRHLNPRTLHCRLRDSY